jgi:hypothetical protein
MQIMISAYGFYGRMNCQLGKKALPLGMIFICLLLMLTMASCKKEQTEVEDVLFEEDFSDNSLGWPEGQYEVADLKIENGAYIIESKIEDPNYFFQIYSPQHFAGSYNVEVIMANLYGDDSLVYGIQYYRKDTYNLYNFFLNSDKFFISYVYNYNYHVICDWTYSSSIKPTGQYNTILIDISGNHMDFYINDVLVHQYSAQITVGEKFGLQIAGKGKVGFDYIKIYRLISS